MSSLLQNNLVCHELGHTVGFADGGTLQHSCMDGGDNNMLRPYERGKLMLGIRSKITLFIFSAGLLLSGLLFVSCGESSEFSARIYSDEYPPGVLVFQPTYKTMEELIASSDLVVVGTVAGYQEDIDRQTTTQEGMDAGDPWSQTIVDGIVITPSKVLKGADLLNGETRFSILVSTITFDTEGEIVRGPAFIKPIDALRHGVAVLSRRVDQRPVYLLFLKNTDLGQDAKLPTFVLHATNSTQEITDALLREALLAVTPQ